MSFIIYMLCSGMIVVLLGCMFLVTGGALLSRVDMESGNSYGDIAASFFVGMAVWLAVLRTFAYILPSYKLSFYLTGIIFIVLAVLQIKKYGVPNTARRGQAAPYLIFLAMWIFFTLFNLMKRLCDVNSGEIYTDTGIGTLHSCRYVNIALWFTENDKIPVLNQSYGQAMLGSMSRMLGAENTNFTLVLWLAASISFLNLFVYGKLRSRCQRWLSVALTSVVTMGSVSLTVYPALVVDSGYPLSQSGYTDSVAGCVTFVIYLAYLIHILEETHKLTVFDYLFSAAMILYWAMSAPQNIVVTGAIGICFIGRLLVKRKYELAKSALKIAGAILCGCFLGVLEGGMLTPGFLTEQIKLAGVMQFSMDGDTSLKISFLPVMPYYINALQSYSWKLSYIEDLLQRAEDAYRNGSFGLALYTRGLLVWDSIRIVFWPLMGIVWTARAAYIRKKNDYWAVSAVIVFVIGYIITFVFEINSYKWELSRFMLPAYFAGMLLLAFWLGEAWSESRSRLFVTIAIGVILAGDLPYKIKMLLERCQQDHVFSMMKEMVMFTDRYL